MEFLLNHTRLFIFSFVTLFAQSFFMLVSFYFSKKFMDMEMDKLKKESTHFDLGLILAFGMIISTIISFVGTLIVNATAKYFFTDPEYLYSSYFELLIVFSAILLASCVLFARTKEHLRFKNISHTDSKNVHKKFTRMVLVSLFITTVAYSVVNTLLGTQYSLICEYCAIGVIIIYCFGEICLSHDLISKVLNLKKTKTITVSEKIVNFLNHKFQYIMLFCMIYAVEINCRDQLNDTAAFTHINNVYLFLLAIIAFQCIVVVIVNKFSSYINSLDDGTRSERLVQSRSNNMIWMCNFIVLSMYFVVVCTALQYAGVNVKKYVFNEYFMIVIFGSFITIMLCRIFNEFRDMILEKAEKGDQEHYLKLKTFAPTLSAIFYFVLLLTAILIILSNLGIDVTPVVASFSIFSAAFALASQDIIKAFLQGLTLLIEKNLYIGDFVDINDKSGTIEKLSVRVLYLRAINGCLHVIPYNMINSITNHSDSYTRHSEVLRLVSQNDIEKASKILINLVEEMKKEPQYKDKILSEVIIHGLEPFGLTGVKVKWEVVTHPTLVHISDDVYHRLVKKFKTAGIQIPEMANNVSIREE